MIDDVWLNLVRFTILPDSYCTLQLRLWHRTDPADDAYRSLVSPNWQHSKHDPGYTVGRVHFQVRDLPHGDSPKKLFREHRVPLLLVPGSSLLKGLWRGYAELPGAMPSLFH